MDQEEAQTTVHGYDSPNNLIINYLPQTLSDQEFRSMFQSIGQVKSAKVIRDKLTGYSYGFGFVDYENKADAERAIKSLNGLQMQNKRIKVAYSRKGSEVKGANLYVRNLPIYWTENELNAYFKPYGTIVQSRVLVDLQTGVSRRVGFVLFDNRPEAESAIECLNGKAPSDSPDALLIKFADDSSKKVKPPPVPRPPFHQGMAPQFPSAGPAPGPMRNHRSRAHFSPMGAQANNGMGGYTSQTQDGHVLFVYNIGTDADEKTLWELFGPCGTVSKVNVIMDHEHGKCKGYGFVTMPNYEEAEYAITIRNGTWYNGKQLQVSFKN